MSSQHQATGPDWRRDVHLVANLMETATLMGQRWVNRPGDGCRGRNPVPLDHGWAAGWQGVLVAFGVLACLAAPAVAQERELLELVPREAVFTVVVTDLRETSRAILDSDFWSNLQTWPAYESWLRSGGMDRFSRSIRSIEAVIGTSAKTVRDDLIGDEVALCLVPGPEPESGRGLLLARCRDRVALMRMIGRFNAAEIQEGTQVRVDQIEHAGSTYSVRRFRPGSKPDEAYAILTGDLFVWANDESLVRGAIDRLDQGGGLAVEPWLRRIRAQLPARPLVQLYGWSPVLIGIMNGAGADVPQAAGRESLTRLSLDACGYSGTTLDWQSGWRLHTYQELLPDRLVGPEGVALRNLLERSAVAPAGTLARKIPASTPLRLSLRLDWPALYQLGLTLVPPAEKPRTALLTTMLEGLLLGRSLPEEILPNIGPEAAVFLAPDGTATPLAWSAVWPLAPEGGVDTALRNAIQTFLVMIGLDQTDKTVSQNAVAPTELTLTRQPGLGGTDVISLGDDPEGFGFSVTPEHLVLGTVSAVRQFPAAAGSGDGLPAPLADLAANAQMTLSLDIAALSALGRRHREILESRLNLATPEASRDLEQALTLDRLFQWGVVAIEFAPGAAAFEVRIGLQTEAVQAEP